MKIENFINKEELSHNKKYVKVSSKMQDLIVALNKKKIPDEFISVINDDIKNLNSFFGTDKQLIKLTKKTTAKILKLVDTKLKLVSKHHYRNVGMIIGMLFGPIVTLPFDGFGYSGLGMILGMAIGIGIGTNLDTKAAKEGKQLDVEHVGY
ncbi:MAG: hypothetical protein QM478_07095 [Flavobacteriaceae bacterium]